MVSPTEYKDGVTKCNNCQSENNYSDRVTDRIDYTTLEKERACNSCGTIIDYWCTGHWEHNEN